MFYNISQPKKVDQPITLSKHKDNFNCATLIVAAKWANHPVVTGLNVFSCIKKHYWGVQKLLEVTYYITSIKWWLHLPLVTLSPPFRKQHIDYATKSMHAPHVTNSK